MPCLLGCLAVLFPRVVLVLVWLFSNYLGRAYETWVWPLLGFFFLPLTTLAYAFAINQIGSVTRGYLVLVVLAALVDLGFIGGGGWANRLKRRRQRLPRRKNVWVRRED